MGGEGIMGRERIDLKMGGSPFQNNFVATKDA